MDEKLSIKVNVAERFYPLKIDADEEEKIRNAAKLINEKVLQYKQRYSDKDTQDFLAMAALQYATKVLEFEQNASPGLLIEGISDINTELEEYLSNE